MNSLNIIPKNSTHRLFLLPALVFIAVAFASIALAPGARAQLSPPPDGGYANNNTAEGTDALFSLTTGSDNTASGFDALVSNTDGSFDTATGSQSLTSNTDGNSNTATGFRSLQSNTDGSDNTANGNAALRDNTTGNDNTATGVFALDSNTTGSQNTATGNVALARNTMGGFNTASGAVALFSNTTGSNNTADGYQALQNDTGSNNVALGFNAGQNLTTGNNNIDIGADVVGTAAEANTIRIGTQGVQTVTFIAGIGGAPVVGKSGPVFADGDGRLGTRGSSARFKEQIRPMAKASEGILALKPVTFRYKKEVDPDGIPQFGLVAEEVEKVNPDLVVRDERGKVYSVRYEAVNAMLLNEFLKEHRKVEEQEATIAQLRSGMEALTATVKEQATQIRQVNDRLELSEKGRPLQIVAESSVNR